MYQFESPKAVLELVLTMKKLTYRRRDRQFKLFRLQQLKMLYGDGFTKCKIFIVSELSILRSNSRSSLREVFY